ncbi:hypothetical protein SAMN05216570_3419 [Dyella sp. OK004]|uniref:hypothetical protein n=1 Tax=Dyella sp. OK004 TaxID=1855292 RepID=UPI0008EE3FEE|nr:hypothetical protein [Dyella sp. OK004]SFS16926.1 hypothetical protein SAMN05216570_3419 [Dyella sp. OK004]
MYPGQRFLIIYSGVLTAVFAVTVLSGFVQSPKKLTLEQLDVQRINVRESDGTLRLIISNADKSPGNYNKNKEYPRPDRRTAGMVFLNDEGSENGGLAFGGERDKDGTRQTYGHLSFDAYDQDQVMSLDAYQQGNVHRNEFRLTDRPDFPLSELMDYAATIKDLPKDEQSKKIMAYFDEHGGRPMTRLVLGKGTDNSVGLAINDTKGHPRIVLSVAADGSPSIRTLDETGKPLGELSAKH